MSYIDMFSMYLNTLKFRNDNCSLPTIVAAFGRLFVILMLDVISISLRDLWGRS
jgi:hypothetical protein